MLARARKGSRPAPPRGDHGRALASGHAGAGGMMHPVSGDRQSKGRERPMTTDPDTGTAPTLAERMRLDIDRRWLFAIAGVIWMGVGILLLTYAVTWLAPVSVPLELELTVAGLAVAAVFLRFVFHGIVTKNIARIEGGPARVSAYSFQGWKSYLITVFMIVLGIV